MENDVRLAGKCALCGAVELFGLMSLPGYEGQLIPGWSIEKKNTSIRR